MVVYSVEECGGFRRELNPANMALVISSWDLLMDIPRRRMSSTVAGRAYVD